MIFINKKFPGSQIEDLSNIKNFVCPVTGFPLIKIEKNRQERSNSPFSGALITWDYKTYYHPEGRTDLIYYIREYNQTLCVKNDSSKIWKMRLDKDGNLFYVACTTTHKGNIVPRQNSLVEGLIQFEKWFYKKSWIGKIINKINYYFLRRKGLVFPVVKRIAAQTLSQDLVSVQPMEAPTAQLLYFDYSYDKDKTVDPLTREESGTVWSTRTIPKPSQEEMDAYISKMNIALSTKEHIKIIQDSMGKILSKMKLSEEHDVVEFTDKFGNDIKIEKTSGKVCIRPVKTAEYIVVDFKIEPQA